MKDDKKIKFIKALEFLDNQRAELNNTSIIKKIDNLQEDFKNDFFTIVVLGEFKRGKSTFVNSLLGENILPTDVIPTTATINALMWSKERKTFVVKNKEQTEIGESSLQFLSKYVADEQFDVDEIKYLKIGYPAEILKDNIVIVDTPGVSDINENRVQVTYDFIPRANAVIFLLDATSPLKKTEKEFIEEHLLQLGMDRVIFIANKFDNIDQEEDDDVLQNILKRLKNAFKKNVEKDIVEKFEVIAMSSTLAFEGVKTNNQELIIESGLVNVRNKIAKIVEEGTVSENKNLCYEKRIFVIIEAIKREINNKIILLKTDVDELEKVLKNMDEMVIEEEKRKEKISDFINNEKRNILSMMKKSLDYFYVDFSEEINESIENYKGLDFKDFIEIKITAIIRKKINRWVNINYIAIDKFLEKLEKEITVGLTNYFKTRIVINGKNSCEIINQTCNIIDIEAEDISNVSTKAGIISATGVGLLMMIGGPMFIPFVSMAAYPALRKKMMENKLKEVKLDIKPVINKVMNESFVKVENEISNDISNRIAKMKNSTEENYNKLYDVTRKQIELEIINKEKYKNDMDEKIKILRNRITILNEFKL